MPARIQQWVNDFCEGLDEEAEKVCSDTEDNGKVVTHSALFRCVPDEDEEEEEPCPEQPRPSPLLMPERKRRRLHDKWDVPQARHRSCSRESFDSCASSVLECFSEFRSSPSPDEESFLVMFPAGSNDEEVLKAFERELATFRGKEREEKE